jgi:hypothetical protein
MPVEQATPKAEPSLAGEQSVKRAKGDVAHGPPLHAAETNTPDRHDGLAQHRSGQGWLWPRSHWSTTQATRAANLDGCHGKQVQWLLHRRMNAQQQMRWTPRGAHLMLKVRCAVMNGTLEHDHTVAEQRARRPFRRPAA